MKTQDLARGARVMVSNQDCKIHGSVGEVLHWRQNLKSNDPTDMLVTVLIHTGGYETVLPAQDLVRIQVEGTVLAELPRQMPASARQITGTLQAAVDSDADSASDTASYAEIEA